MVLDGIAVSAIARHLADAIVGGRIDKINQPEKDEITLNIRNFGENRRLLLTANASNPRVHFTAIPKENPLNAPLFCMVLRKHLLGGRVVSVVQPDFERILSIGVESATEMGDITRKELIIEIMGKHSNIILTDSDGIVLDSIKRVGHDKSSVREILPGKSYVAPPNKGKFNPLKLNAEIFAEKLANADGAVIAQKFLYETFSGISPTFAAEICRRAEIDESCPISALSDKERHIFCEHFLNAITQIKENNYDYAVVFDESDKIFGFTTLPTVSAFKTQKFVDLSEMLEYFYHARDEKYHMAQRTQDIRRLIATNIERVTRKIDIYDKNLNDIKDRDKYRLYGELLTANIYALTKGMSTFTAVNFYDENRPEVVIPLDAAKTPSENAQRHFKRYNKEKRTFDAMVEQKKQALEELNYLESAQNSVMAAADEADLDEIRAELADLNYVKRKNAKKGAKKTKKSKPLQFTSSDGFTIFVGKSNTQNDSLTFGADKDDIWLHAKDIPGSHVIIKTQGRGLTNAAIEEAARIAARYSKAKESVVAAVDYTQRRNVKKPSGAKPGFVVYDNYKTAYVKP